MKLLLNISKRGKRRSYVQIARESWDKLVLVNNNCYVINDTTLYNDYDAIALLVAELHLKNNKRTYDSLTIVAHDSDRYYHQYDIIVNNVNQYVPTPAELAWEHRNTSYTDDSSMPNSLDCWAPDEFPIDPSYIEEQYGITGVSVYYDRQLDDYLAIDGRTLDQIIAEQNKIDENQRTVQSDLNNSEFVKELLHDNEQLMRYADSIETSHQLLRAILLACKRAGDAIENGNFSSREQEKIRAHLWRPSNWSCLITDEDNHAAAYCYLCNDRYYV